MCPLCPLFDISFVEKKWIFMVWGWMFFRSPVFFCPVLFFLFFISSFFRYLRSKIRSSLLKRFYSFFFLSFCISKKDLFSISSFSPFVAVLDQMIFSMFYHFTTTRRGGSLYPVHHLLLLLLLLPLPATWSFIFLQFQV